MFSSKPLVIVLLGPTASGKTDLAIDLAKYFKINIHNIDSRQIYKEMNIGTAKPTEEQQKEIKHHLVDIELPSRHLNVKQFQEIAMRSINKEIENKKCPFLVGGSGLYLNSIISGFITPGVPPQNSLRKQLLKLDQIECWNLLKMCDPKSTSSINFADKTRTIRALEVFYATGKPISSQQSINPPPWRILELGLDRVDLKSRILTRTQYMFNNGIIEETKKIIQKYGYDLPLLKTIGYQDAKLVLENNLSIEEAVEKTTIKTIKFAKRQRTWFRNKNKPTWLNTKNPLKDAIIRIESAIC
ncbi:MAG: tRNA (adenosine(37)-N6)-dimethylallyltransferase MiaA [Prochlorococcus sp. SP3034]|nr:tRNA (adenosine(37)-N6)-dimethylallyltransferase MiaA [Prochlorococcus sp. SP3034]|tara:strand:- start:760 stop:1659 length:900 start_codon:yes stop_codon:yes gene_type:complete